MRFEGRRAETAHNAYRSFKEIMEGNTVSAYNTKPSFKFTKQIQNLYNMQKHKSDF